MNYLHFTTKFINNFSSFHQNTVCKYEHNFREILLEFIIAQFKTFVFAGDVLLPGRLRAVIWPTYSATAIHGTHLKRQILRDRHRLNVPRHQRCNLTKTNVFLEPE